jgi:hypothetical protein
MQLRLPPGGPAREAFTKVFPVYGMLTGADFGFSYFAPEIGSELRARFDIVDKSGGHSQDLLERNVSREGTLRIMNVIGLLGGVIREEKARRALAASWAGKIFARHPEAGRVTVVLESYELPPMQAYREGARTRWSSFYRATYSRRGRP